MFGTSNNSRQIRAAMPRPLALSSCGLFASRDILEDTLHRRRLTRLQPANCFGSSLGIVTQTFLDQLVLIQPT
jgi:hypothetical protein